MINSSRAKHSWSAIIWTSRFLAIFLLFGITPYLLDRRLNYALSAYIDPAGSSPFFDFLIGLEFMAVYIMGGLFSRGLSAFYRLLILALASIPVICQVIVYNAATAVTPLLSEIANLVPLLIIGVSFFSIITHVIRPPCLFKFPDGWPYIAWTLGLITLFVILLSWKGVKHVEATLYQLK